MFLRRDTKTTHRVGDIRRMDKKISIVTGTLNRLNLLKRVVQNTVDSCEDLELVLVDGGSTDGTLEWLRSLAHPRIKLVEIGGRSPYWHYMNAGVRAATHEWVCQWNDDVVLSGSWDNVLKELEDGVDIYLFSWRGADSNTEYFILDKAPELVMNYGVYSKKVFREAGLYHDSFFYYHCDGDMSARAHYMGFRHKKLYDVKCDCLQAAKSAIYRDPRGEWANYQHRLAEYQAGRFDIRDRLEQNTTA